MISFSRRWKNVSIAKRLYFVVGLMAVLIAGELLTLRFAMRNLSAARAFVGGEGLWSKSQKNAIFSLQRFAVTGDEKDFQAYLTYLQVPEGDHRARMELMKKHPDMNVIREGFMAGHIQNDDIVPMVLLLRRFYWVSYLSRAIQIWTEGDQLLSQLKSHGETLHAAVLSGDHSKARDALLQIKDLNEKMTDLEEGFSFALGEGSRWLEHIVLSLLTGAVLVVESIGLSITFLTTRSISRGLNQLNAAAEKIGKGDFENTVPVESRDEIGQLGVAVNTMGQLLRKSYGELEKRVEERTAELAKLAADNARLYEEAKQAVQTRDEFLSIASHELKTPLTSLFLQLQRLARAAAKNAETAEEKTIANMAEASVNLTRRTSGLLDELLDLTRLRIGKFELHRQNCDVVPTVSDVIANLTPEASRAGIAVTLRAAGPVHGDVDVTRVGQIVTNLLSNAIKYGAGKPVEVDVRNENEKAVISVHDNGVGIPDEQKAKIFERFERGTADRNISGLGLGLYISNQIAKAHGGTISVESEPGKGSTFTVRL